MRTYKDARPAGVDSARITRQTTRDCWSRCGLGRGLEGGGAVGPRRADMDITKTKQNKPDNQTKEKTREKGSEGGEVATNQNHKHDTRLSTR